MSICGYISRLMLRTFPDWYAILAQHTQGVTLTFGSCAGLDTSSTRYVMFIYHTKWLYEERGALAKGHKPRRTSSEKAKHGNLVQLDILEP